MKDKIELSNIRYGYGKYNKESQDRFVMNDPNVSFNFPRRDDVQLLIFDYKENSYAVPFCYTNIDSERIPKGTILFGELKRFDAESNQVKLKESITEIDMNYVTSIDFDIDWRNALTKAVKNNIRTTNEFKLRDLMDYDSYASFIIDVGIDIREKYMNEDLCNLNEAEYQDAIKELVDKSKFSIVLENNLNDIDYNYIHDEFFKQNEERIKIYASEYKNTVLSQNIIEQVVNEAEIGFDNLKKIGASNNTSEQIIEHNNIKVSNRVR